MAFLSRQKYYPIDPSFYGLKGTDDIETARKMETIVALELLRRGYRIFTGRIHRLDITFIALGYRQRLYIQLAENLEDPKELEELVEPLLEIEKKGQRLILTLSRQDPFTIQNIQILSIADWLISQEQEEDFI